MAASVLGKLRVGRPPTVRTALSGDPDGSHVGEACEPRREAPAGRPVHPKPPIPRDAAVVTAPPGRRSLRREPRSPAGDPVTGRTGAGKTCSAGRPLRPRSGSLRRTVMRTWRESSSRGRSVEGAVGPQLEHLVLDVAVGPVATSSGPTRTSARAHSPDGSASVAPATPSPAVANWCRTCRSTSASASSTGPPFLRKGRPIGRVPAPLRAAGPARHPVSPAGRATARGWWRRSRCS